MHKFSRRQRSRVFEAGTAGGSPGCALPVQKPCVDNGLRSLNGVLWLILWLPMALCGARAGPSAPPREPPRPPALPLELRSALLAQIAGRVASQAGERTDGEAWPPASAAARRSRSSRARSSASSRFSSADRLHCARSRLADRWSHWEGAYLVPARMPRPGSDRSRQADLARAWWNCGGRRARLLRACSRARVLPWCSRGTACTAMRSIGPRSTRSASPLCGIEAERVPRKHFQRRTAAGTA